MYHVTERGLEQIKQWLLHEWCCEADEVGDLAEAVHAYARIAEDAEDGEIELRARQTASGRIAYLRPERVAVQVED
jgi:DNA-binding PadR family transcriptional regulator